MPGDGGSRLPRGSSLNVDSGVCGMSRKGVTLPSSSCRGVIGLNGLLCP